MSSLKQKGLEEIEKQRCLDEIHQKPEVKKIFTTCEIFLTIDWITNIAFFSLLIIGIFKNNLSSVVDISSIIYVLLNAVGGYIVATCYIVLKILLSKLKKSMLAKLEVLEKAGLEEIKKAKEDGTYQPGPKASLVYRIYRAIRTWSTIIVILTAFIVAFVKII